MNRGTTLFLRLVVILIGLVILAACIFLAPGIANYAGKLYPDRSYLEPLLYIQLYVSAIPFYFALYQSLQLLGNIDKNKAFSDLSVLALKKIKYCGITIGVLYVVGMPLFYLLADKDDAPGIIVIGMVIIFASLVIAVFAGVLEKLLKEAIAIKSENDLTV